MIVSENFQTTIFLLGVIFISSDVIAENFDVLILTYN